MKLVKCIAGNGHPIWINPEYVQQITVGNAEDSSVIRYQNGDQTIVSGHVDKIASRLGWTQEDET